MILSQLIANSVVRLTPYVGGRGEAQAMMREIMLRLKNYSPVDCVLHGDNDVTPWLIDSVEQVVMRVCAGEPLQYVLGKAHFMGNDYKVTPATLIPRPETSMLVDMITDHCGDRADLRLLDIGTGSGCIAISLARALKFADITATDISENTLAVARENASALKVRITFRQEDILVAQPVAETFDIIVSNPPYIADSEAATMEDRVKNHEPHSALFVPDENPLIFYKAIAHYAATALVAGGLLYFEINPLFANDLRNMLVKEGFVDVELHRDFADKVRFASAIRPAL